MAKVKIKQVRSAIGNPKNQKATLIALGLTRIGKCVEQELNPQIQGMINKVSHLVNVEEV
jgi:large subunit ribosomal protein L30